MYKHRWRNRWEAKEPVHLIGWTIEEHAKKADSSGFVKTRVTNNVTKEQRECWIHKDVIPMEITQRNW